jgi:hypothetical protein
MRRPTSQMRSPQVPIAFSITGATLAIGMMAACAIDEPTGSRVGPRVSFGKTATTLTVTATSPDSAFQGDTGVVVHVTGSGFAPGARAQWQLAGDTTHIHTLSTTYVSSKEVVARIKVDGDAPIAPYDVAVTLLDGKKGVGAELFTVKQAPVRQQDSIPIAVTIDDTGPAGASRIKSDGLGEYVNGVQGMLAEIDHFGNLQITPLNGAATTPAARSVVFDFSAPADPLNTYRPNVSDQTNFKILTIAYDNPRIQDLAVDQSACYRLTFSFRNLTTHHDANFSSAYDPQAAFALITRTSDSAWTMVTDGTCGPHPTWAAVRSQDLTRKNAPLVARGNYSLPFSIRFRTL